MSNRNIAVIGGAHMDRRGRISATTALGASNPGSWFEEPGGGAFNAACALSRLGHKVVLICPRGGDSDGEKVGAAAAAAGIIDQPFVFLDRRTPSYTAILENDGNLVIGLADMELYQLFSPRRLASRAIRDALSTADMVLTDANIAEDTLKALAAKTAGLRIPLCAIAISPAKVIRLVPILSSLACLFMNEAEAAIVAGASTQTAAEWPQLLRAAGLASAVITRGRLGAVAYDASGSVILAPQINEDISDVTGAGDGMAAGFIDAMLAGKKLHAQLECGTALATMTVRSPFATVQDLDRTSLEEEAAHIPLAKNLA